jgi:hypothetical protein
LNQDESVAIGPEVPVENALVLRSRRDDRACRIGGEYAVNHNSRDRDGFDEAAAVERRMRSFGSCELKEGAAAFA